MNTLPVFSAFLTGLFAGGITCMAVQGGLFTATMAQTSGIKRILPLLSFLLARLVVYTILGGILGYLGSFFQFSLQTQVVLQFVVVVFMLGTAFDLLNVHPLFRYFIIKPPQFLNNLLSKESQGTRHLPVGRQVFAPAIMGGSTVFIPCGTTQAMMLLAVSTGTTLLGALTLFAFILGTSPLFFIIGYTTIVLKHAFSYRFVKFVAFLLILLALFNLNNALALAASPVTFDTVVQKINCAISFCDDSPVFSYNNFPVEEATITINSSGYTPNNLVLKSNATITLHLVNNGGAGCVSAFTIPSLGIQKVVPVGSSDTIIFKTPEKPTDLSFMCNAGLYRGRIRVI